MALSTKALTIAAKTTTGTQAYTGVGFQPKALLLYTAGGTTFDSVAAHCQFGMGMTDGTTDFSVTFSAQDNVATSVAKQRGASSCISLYSSTGTLLVEASWSAFGADGFTLNYTTVDGTAHKICVLAFGGSDLTGVKVKQHTAATSTGSVTYTGYGFTPAALITMGCGVAGSLPAAGAHARYNVGIATGTGVGDQAGFGEITEDAITSTSKDEASDYQAAFVTAHGIKAGTPLGDGAAAVTELNSDGFKLNWTTAGLGAWNFGVLALAGGQFKFGEFTVPGGTGTTAVTGVGFTPTGVLHFGYQGPFGAQVGAASGTSAVASASAGDDNVSSGNTDSSRYVSDTKFCHVLSAASGGSVVAAATLSSFDSDGFTPNWSSVSGSWKFAYLAVGSTAAASTTVMVSSL